MKKAFRRIFGLGIAGITVAAFLFGLAVFALPSGGSGVFTGRQENMVADAANAKSEITGSCTGSVSEYSTSTTVSVSGGASLDTGKQQADSSTKPYDSDAKATLTFTLTFSGNLATAITNGRLKVDIIIDGTYRAKAWSATHNSQSTSYFYVSSSGGLSTNAHYFKDATGGNGTDHGDSDPDSTFSRTINGTPTGNTITFKLESNGHAHVDHNNIFQTRYADTWAKVAITKVTVKMSTNKPTVTFQSANSTMGTVSSASGQPDFNTTVNSTAQPNEGYYFTGWTNGGNYVKQTSAQGYTIKTNPTYTANFARITKTTATDFNYTGNAQGVALNVPSGYTAKNYYRLKGATSWSASNATPTAAGTYEHYGELWRNSEKQGTSAISEFTIRKSNPNVRVDTAGQAVFGRPISDAKSLDGVTDENFRAELAKKTVAMQVSATNSNNANQSVAGEWQWETPNALTALGGETYTITFTPADTANFNIINVEVTLNGVSGLILNINDGMGNSAGHTIRLNPKSSDTTGSHIHSDESAHAEVEFVKAGTEDYFLLGWKKNNVYLSEEYYGASGDTCHFPILTGGESEIFAFIEAVVVKINGFEDVSVPYTGAPYMPTITFSQAEGDVGLGYNNPTYKVKESGNLVSSIIGVGSYTAEMLFYNATLSTPTSTVWRYQKTIEVNVTKNTVSVAVDRNASAGYNETIGWARGFVLNLGVPNARSGSIEGYQVSVNGGAWTDINGTIAASQGCAVTYTPAAVAGSEVRTVRFRAIHLNRGGVVAESEGDGVLLKTDNVTPTIDSVDVSTAAGPYDGTWTNKTVTFAFTVSHGGSGVIVQLFQQDGSWATLGGEWNEGSENLTQTTVSVDYANDTNLTNCRFRVLSGTEYSAERAERYDVLVDKSAPVLRQNTQKLTAWKSEAHEVILGAMESDTGRGYSGISSISVWKIQYSGFLEEYDEWRADSDDTYTREIRLTICDRATYRIRVVDLAGNENELDVQESVDTDLPEVTEVRGYVADTWTNQEVFLSIDVVSGGSGMQLYYTETPFTNIEGEKIAISDNTTWELENSNYVPCEGTYQLHLTAEQNSIYKFYLRNRFGEEVVHEFGKVKIDTTAPSYEFVTNLSLLQGDAQWLDSAQNCDVRIEDRARIAVTEPGGQVAQTAISGISSFTVCNGNLEIATELRGAGVYRFALDRASAYTIRIEDEAGNATEHSFQVKIDCSEPTVGEGNSDWSAMLGMNEYNFRDWVSASMPLVITMNVTFTASGIRPVYAIDGGENVIWTSMINMLTNADQVSVVNGYIYEKGHETEPNQSATLTFEWSRDIQTDLIRFAVETGSGKRAEATQKTTESPKLKVDRTAPIVGDWSLSPDTARTEWTAGAITGQFSATDGAEGSGIASVVVKRFSPEVENIATVWDAVDDEVTFESVSNRVIMDTYAVYGAKITDAAGNVTYSQGVRVLIDTTENFTLNYTSQVVGNDANANGWMLNGRAVLSFRIDGISQWGASGGRIECSWDDGATWVATDEKFSIANPASMAPVFTLEKDQDRTYRFRAVTGAGTAAYAANTYAFKRDGIQPNVSLSARRGTEGYYGAWSADPVQIVATYTVGTSGGQLYYMLTDSTTFPNADDLTQWTAWDAVEEGTNAIITRVFNEDLTGKYMHVILRSGTDRQGRNHSVVLNIDTAEPTAAPTATVNGDPYSFGDWTNQTVTIAVNAVSGDSGYRVYYSYAPAGGSYGTEYALSGDTLEVTSSADGQYRFRVVSGAGKAITAEAVTVRIDKVTVAGSLNVNGESVQSEGRTWWISEIMVRLNTVNSGKSSIYGEFSTADETDDWSEWIRLDGYDYSVADPSEKGGTQKYYRFRLKNEAGTATDPMYVSGEEGLIRIDTNRYGITVMQMLQGSEAYCGSVAGVGAAFRRGATQTVKVTANNGYWLKHAETPDPGQCPDYPAVYGTGTSEDSYNITVAGEDVTVVVDFYVETDIALAGLTQYLKSGAIQPVVAELPANFPMTLLYEIRYESETEVPQSIGYYPIQLTVRQDAVLYRLTEATPVLTVRYFPQAGDYSDPYQIDGLDDFEYIDEYFRRKAADDTWLAVPNQPSFLQTKDIEITQSDVESGAYLISQKFEGAEFNGNGYRIYATEPLRVDKDFHLFTEVSSSQIYNMGVEISLIIEENGTAYDPILVSPLAGIMRDAMAMYVYVIGDITANGTYMQIGGFSAVSYGTLYGYSFVDLSVEGRLSDSSVGSLAGEMSGSGIYNNYVLPRFSIKGERNSVGIIGGKLYGNLTDVTAGEEDMERGSVYYRSNGIGINGDAADSIGFGNLADNGLLDTYFDFAERDHGWFLACEDVIGEGLVSEKSEARRVKALARVKTDACGIEGDGTEENPYRIKTVEDLKFLDILPWAWFKLTTDLNLSEYTARLAEGIPFSGVLDGDNHRLGHYTASMDDIGGLFRTLSGTVTNLSLIDFNITVAGTNAVGGILAANVVNGTLRTVTVTGSLRVDGTDVTVGGVAGAATASDFDDVAIQVYIKGTGETVYAGGIIGNADNIVTQNVISLSTVNANFTLSNMAGLAYGSVNNTRDNNISYVLQNSLYLNDKQAAAVYGENLNAVTPVGTYSYNYLMENRAGLQDRLERVYPFRVGMGTQADPFLIYDYRDLLRINDYLYADFRLANDILIGDKNGDGVLTAEDEYAYDFKPIGQGAAFGGALDGMGESNQSGTHLYRIDGLTDSLFETVTGTVKNLYLNVNYVVVDVKSDTHSMAVKEAKENENITYGAVAKYLRGESASVRTVIVGGDISVSVKGNAKAVVGGVIGESHGGTVLGVISGANIAVNAPVAEVGGVAGYVRGLRLRATDDAMPSLDINIPVGTVRVNGGLCSVGYLVGRQAGSADVDTSIEYDVDVYLNGVKVDISPIGRGAMLSAK